KLKQCFRDLRVTRARGVCAPRAVGMARHDDVTQILLPGWAFVTAGDRAIRCRRPDWGVGRSRFMEAIATFVVLSVVVGMFILFMSERFPPEAVALGAVATLLVSGVLKPNEAVESLANSAPVTIGALFIVSAALVRTGVLDWV